MMNFPKKQKFLKKTTKFFVSSLIVGKIEKAVSFLLQE